MYSRKTTILKANSNPFFGTNVFRKDLTLALEGVQCFVSIAKSFLEIWTIFKEAVWKPKQHMQYNSKEISLSRREDIPVDSLQVPFSSVYCY